MTLSYTHTGKNFGGAMTGSVKNFTGQKFGRLTALQVHGKPGHRNRQVLCLCDCGTRVIARIDNLRAGKTRSCGCLAHDLHFERQMQALDGALAPLLASDAAPVDTSAKQAALVAAGADKPEDAAGRIVPPHKRASGAGGYYADRGMEPYYLEPGEYDRRFAEQGGVCAACGDMPPAGRRLNVDHDHATGKIRGLLCVQCNVGIGCFKNDLMRMAKAMKYLSSSSQ